jgi:hypothetical protein
VRGAALPVPASIISHPAARRRILFNRLLFIIPERRLWSLRAFKPFFEAIKLPYKAASGLFPIVKIRLNHH